MSDHWRHVRTLARLRRAWEEQGPFPTANHWARASGVSLVSIRRAIEAGELPDVRPWTKAEMEEKRTLARELRRQGATLPTVAAVLEVSPAVVALWSRRGLIPGGRTRSLEARRERLRERVLAVWETQGPFRGFRAWAEAAGVSDTFLPTLLRDGDPTPTRTRSEEEADLFDHCRTEREMDMVLRYLEGQTHKQIAEGFGVTTQRAQQILARVKARRAEAEMVPA